MIEVEIRGPVAVKEFEKLKRTLEISGEVFSETRVTVAYTDRGYNNREVRLEYRNSAARIVMHVGRVGERKEIIVPIAYGGFSDAVRMLVELGYKKASVSVEAVLSSNYGGAAFSLFAPRDDSYHYEASISAGNPTEVKEAKQKLDKLARNFKLPIWSPMEMMAFLKKLNETTDYMYDYDTDGADYFKEKFGI
jgi:hypothetical protein